MRDLFEQFGTTGFVVLGVSIVVIVLLLVVICRAVPRRRKRRS